MEENLDEILEQIKEGKISIREAARKTSFKRDFLRVKLIKKYGTIPEVMKQIEETMQDNKVNSTVLQIEEGLLEDVFLRTMNGELSLEQARIMLGNIDKETLRSKFQEQMRKMLKDEVLLEKYKESQKSKRGDYSGINFRVIAIEMIRGDYTQTEMAEFLEIPVRTVSREFEKLKDDEDKELYDLIKFYSDRKMKKQDFREGERMLLKLALDMYEKKNADLLLPVERTKTEERAERMKFLVEEEEKMKKLGLSQAEIADRLGTSISGLRRARLFCEGQNMIRETPIDSTKEKKIPQSDGGDTKPEDGDRI